MQIIYVVTIFIIKWFNTTLLHFFQLLITLPNFSCFLCQVPVSGRKFSGKFLQKFCERGKNAFSTFKLWCLSLILLVSQLQKKDKIWAYPSTHAWGILVSWQIWKPLSTNNVFHPPKALRIKSYWPYCNTRSWLTALYPLPESLHRTFSTARGYQCLP